MKIQLQSPIGYKDTLIQFTNRLGDGKSNQWIKAFLHNIRFKKIDMPQVKINNILIPICSEVKYLGLISDNKLTRNPRLKDKRKALNARLHLLRPFSWSKMNSINKLINLRLFSNHYGHRNPIMESRKTY